MSDTTHRAFFGDAERAFALTPPLVLELERTTGAGVGALCQRVFAGAFHAADLAESIRLALIGAGETPERAKELIDTYVAGRPLAETFPLAISILEALWFGAKPQEAA